jgi:RNA polymerase sporulation-specific sigma factor
MDEMQARRERKLVADAKNSPKAMDRLLRTYEHLCRAVASGYRYPGATHDDVLQEARIGVAKAAVSYDLTSDVPFSRFAQLCIERNVITGLKTAQRGKHRILDGACRVGYTDQGETIELVDLLPSSYSIDPYLVLVAKERLERLVQASYTLTDSERRAVIGIADGDSYATITAQHGMPHKQIDNAAQRARKKLRAAA